MAELKGSESIPTLALSVRPIYYEEAPQWLPFDILKKIDVVNFEWVEVVRNFQAAKKRELKLFAESLS
jgi:hypothetical protein